MLETKAQKEEKGLNKKTEAGPMSDIHLCLQKEDLTFHGLVLFCNWEGHLNLRGGCMPCLHLICFFFFFLLHLFLLVGA